MDKRWSLWRNIHPGHIRWVLYSRPARLVTLFIVLLLLFTLIGAGNPINRAKRAQARVLFPLAIQTGKVFQARSSSHFAPLLAPLYGGNPSLPEIALTFDDGPHPDSTPQIVAILKRFGINATFFCVGQHVQDYPDYVRQEFENGNLVEDHTWSHPQLQLLSSTNVAIQLERTASEIENVTGTMPTLFRPPYGLFTPSVFAQAHRLALSTILWNVDPKDWSLPGASAIASRVIYATNNGSIILLHDGGGNRSQTVAALPTIITSLLQRGFRFVTIEQMILHLTWKAAGKQATTGQSPSITVPYSQTPHLYAQAPPQLIQDWQADSTRRALYSWKRQSRSYSAFFPLDFKFT